MNLGILFGHACVLGMPLQLPGKLPCYFPCLVHHGYAQMQVELITLKLVLDVFDYQPPGGITKISPSSPILHHPQCAASLQPKIHIQAHCQMSHGADGHQSQIGGYRVGVVQHPVLDHQKPSLNEA